MAEIKPRIELEGRTRLETVIPLSTPYLVFLDPSDICNAHCKWCPTGAGIIKKYRNQQFMDWDLYRKIINDLAQMPEPIKTLRLYADGEPLLNPRFPDMVKCAKDTGRFGQVDSTSNGLLLSSPFSRKIIEAGLDKIFISVPNRYTLEYIHNVQLFYRESKGNCKVYVKIIGTHLTPEQREKYFRDFGDISDRIFIENQSECWPDFNAGSKETAGIYGQPITKEVTTCPYVLYSLKINSNGTVSICFLDWKHQTILGDLREDSFKNIWNGKKHQEYQVMHLRGERYSHPMCGKCGQLRCGAPDDVDAYAAIILKKLLDK